MRLSCAVRRRSGALRLLALAGRLGGWEGLASPGWNSRLIGIEQAAESEAYCGEIKGILAIHGLELTEFASHITGQLVAVHPAHDRLMDSFAPTLML